MVDTYAERSELGWTTKWWKDCLGHKLAFIIRRMYAQKIMFFEKTEQRTNVLCSLRYSESIIRLSSF